MYKPILGKSFPKYSFREGAVIESELVLLSVLGNKEGTITTLSRREDSRVDIPLRVRVYTLKSILSESEELPYKLQSLLFTLDLKDSPSTNYDSLLKRNDL